MDYGLQLLTCLIASIDNGIGTEGALSMRQLEWYLRYAERCAELGRSLRFLEGETNMFRDSECSTEQRARYMFIMTLQLKASQTFDDRWHKKIQEKKAKQ